MTSWAVAIGMHVLVDLGLGNKSKLPGISGAGDGNPIPRASVSLQTLIDPEVTQFWNRSSKRS